MRLLFDQNISHRILDKLPDLFEGSTSVKKEGLINAPDKTIWDLHLNLNRAYYLLWLWNHKV